MNGETLQSRAILYCGAVYLAAQGEHPRDRYRAVVCLGVLYKVVLTLESVDETWCVRSKLLNRTVVLFIVLYKVILTFGSVGEILKCARPFKYY